MTPFRAHAYQGRGTASVHRGPRRAARSLAVFAAVAGLLAGCVGGGSSPAPSGGGSPSAGPSRADGSGAPSTVASSAPLAPSGVPSSAASPSAAASASGSAAASVPAGMFVNPVLDSDFPDPFVIKVDDTYYAYATTDLAQQFQIARSTDLVTWEELLDPMPKLPAWGSGETWAPEVFQIDGEFVMYFTARAFDHKRPDSFGALCIGVATSDSPEGPFVDPNPDPFVCQEEEGGSIDATMFEDTDGTKYLIWKNDGNCCGIPTKFFIQELSDDGLELVGEVSEMGLVNDEPWEGGVIEAPTLHREGDTYYLFFSGNGYDTESYAVGYATSKTITGPYVDAPENPILDTAWGGPQDTKARGPGHQAIVADDDGDLWMVYHAWDVEAVGYANRGERDLWIDPLVFEDGKPVVKGPNDQPQPVP